MGLDYSECQPHGIALSEASYRILSLAEIFAGSEACRSAGTGLALSRFPSGAQGRSIHQLASVVVLEMSCAPCDRRGVRICVFYIPGTESERRGVLLNSQR